MKQTMLVRNKKQLFVAVGCAIDFEGVTEITLQREKGTTTYLFDYTKSFHYMKKFNCQVRHARNRIRKTEAICFK